MSTARVILDTTQYVRINARYVSLLLQAHRDEVRIVVSKLQPSRDNTAFHTLGGKDAPLQLFVNDTHVWVLAMTDRSTLIVTESSKGASVSQVMSPIMFNEYAHARLGITSTLTVATSGAGTESSITVADGSIFTVGRSIQISNGTIELSFPKILSKVGNVLVLDRRIDNAHEIGTLVEEISFEMAVIGSLVSPVEFIIKPEGTNVAHIERINLSMTHATAGDMGKFGGITALINGVILRTKINGKYRTLTNWKDNAEMNDDMFDIVFDSRSSGGGTYGTSGEWSLGSFGVEIRLDAATDDAIEFYIQDDLTGLLHFSIKAQGHYEGL